MQSTRRTFNGVIKQALIAIGISALFAIAYAQSPLFTSNQNQYFLHGLAQAGYGSLELDWLAATQDPTPVFSALVATTYRATGWLPIFYLYYAILMGVYAASLISISNQVFNLDAHRLGSLVFFAGLILIHSAGWRFAASRGLGVNWTYILEDGVADQRLLGPVLQPSAFGVFLLLSIALFLKGRPGWAVASAVAAASLHPTYLLSAGVLTATYATTLVAENHRWKRALVLATLALLGVIPILVNTALAFGGDPGLAAETRRLLVTARIPHHAVVSQWLDATAVVKMGFVAAALGILWRRSLATPPGPDPEQISARRLFWILGTATSAAILLTLAQVITRSDTLALIFPWRISTWIVPLAVTVILAAGISTPLNRATFQNPALQAALLAACAVVIFVAVLVGAVRFKLDLERKASAPDRQIERYVRQHQERGQVYLTPVKLQDFRLETGAPVYIDFKSIPYGAADVLEWRRRERLADDFYKFPSCEKLEVFARQEGITHAVLPAANPVSCPAYQIAYQDNSYLLIRLKTQ